MIKLKNVYKSYGSGESKTEALKGVDVTVDDGEYVVILGASGSGKSTLLNVTSGLETPTSGGVFYDGEDISAFKDEELTAFRRRNVGFVFQQYYLLPDMTVEKNVRMGADLAGNKDYGQIIAAVGLENKKKKYPAQLSGGEQQRVSIARALAKKPRILFLDEPTGALDEATGRQVLDYLIKLKRELGFTMVAVTHNENIAATADRIIRMNSGVIAEVKSNPAPKSAYEIGW